MSGKAEVGRAIAIGPVGEVRRREYVEEWPMWKLILITLPQLGVQVLWCFIGQNSAPYMRHLGMGTALATLNNVAGPITGFFTGPIVGATSDNLTSRLGRRRPVIIAGLIATWVAGMLFASAEHVLSEEAALAFAVPMYWVMDVTINILQTPHRALVADLASKRQQVPMQVVFVVFMAVGNFLGYSIMHIYEAPEEHMFELMLGICFLNTACIGIQFLVAREAPLQRNPDAKRQPACTAVLSVVQAVRSSPRLMYHLAAVQCLVWIGSTAWNIYSGQWFVNSVYMGDESAPDGTAAKLAYSEGMEAFGHGGQCKSTLQLISSLAIIGVLLQTNLRPRLVYFPCICIGGIASILAALAVHHQGTFAILCMTLSILPETGSFAIPFGLIAMHNKVAEEEGNSVSTALQMSLMNCCVAVGQQICTTTLAAIEGGAHKATALPVVFLVAAGAQVVAGMATLFLNDKPPESGDKMYRGNSGSSSASTDISNMSA